jgi:hypothetical protein
MYVVYHCDVILWMWMSRVNRRSTRRVVAVIFELSGPASRHTVK